MKKYCIHCKKDIEVKKQSGIAFHRTQCRDNPEYVKCREKQSLAQIVERIQYTFKCKKCSKEYVLILTKSEFKRGKYRKHCSLKCANFRIQTEDTKLRIGNKLRQERKIVLCKFCKKEMVLPKNNTQIFCSRMCSSKYHALDPNWHKLISDSTKGKAGGYRKGSGCGKKCWYNSIIAGRVFLDSTYELAYAEYLDKNKIDWVKNKKEFPYIYKNRVFNYIPDFYLLDTKEYHEVKGYQTDKDLAKWNNFPHKLQILFRKDLRDLGLVVE